MSKVVFSESVCFPDVVNFSFLLQQASLGKPLFLPIQKIPYVRQLPDFSSLLCANAFVFAQNFSLSMQIFSGQLRACLYSTGGLSLCPGALHCCCAAAWALHSWFSSDQSTPLTWISSLSPHTAPHFLQQQLQRAQTAFYFGWNETWVSVCAPGMQLQWAPAANGHLSHESRQELEVSEKTWDAHSVDTSLQHQLFPSATLLLSGLSVCTTPQCKQNLLVRSSEPLQLCPTYKLNSASGMQWTHGLAALYHQERQGLTIFSNHPHLDNTHILVTPYKNMCISHTFISLRYILLYLKIFLEIF